MTILALYRSGCVSIVNSVCCVRRWWRRRKKAAARQIYAQWLTSGDVDRDGKETVWGPKAKGLWMSIDGPIGVVESPENALRVAREQESTMECSECGFMEIHAQNQSDCQHLKFKLWDSSWAKKYRLAGCAVTLSTGSREPLWQYKAVQCNRYWQQLTVPECWR